MLNGYYGGKLAGSGTVVWHARRMLANGEIDVDQFMDMTCASAPSVGHCNTMGTASLDERHGRGAGHVAAPAVRPSPAPTASAARWPTPPAGARSRWSGRT